MADRLGDLLWEVQEAVQYKPGSMVVIKEPLTGPEVIEVYVSIKTVDAWHHDRPYRVGTTHRFSSYPVRSLIADGNHGGALQMVLDQVRRAIRLLEDHEVDEFLTVHGEHRFNPHKEG